MQDAIITVENLSKSYLVGHITGIWARSHYTLRDVIGREARNFTRKACRPSALVGQMTAWAATKRDSGARQRKRFGPSRRCDSRAPFTWDRQR
jgi:hypothetical protein